MTIWTLLTDCGHGDVFIRNFASKEGAQKAMEFEYRALADDHESMSGYIEEGYAEFGENYWWNIYETEVES